MQNATQSAVTQGLTINKSLHWLKVAVHELAAKRVPSTLRNSGLTRLLAPSLSGGAHVSLVVCSSLRPPTRRPTLSGCAAGRMLRARSDVRAKTCALLPKFNFIRSVLRRKTSHLRALPVPLGLAAASVPCPCG